MIKHKMRKVIYTSNSLIPRDSIAGMPAATDSGETSDEETVVEVVHKRSAYFHFWGELLMRTPYTDAEKSRYERVTVAIVEDCETGEVHSLIPDTIVFETEPIIK